MKSDQEKSEPITEAPRMSTPTSAEWSKSPPAKLAPTSWRPENWQRWQEPPSATRRATSLSAA